MTKQANLTIDEFVADIPLLHYWGGKHFTGGFGPIELQALHKMARDCPGARIVETGAGNSTLAFLLAAPASVVSIAPDAGLFGRIRAFADAHGLARDALCAIVDVSEDALPHLCRSEPAWDIALIDGGHGWPTVFVDFCYCAANLRTNGLLIVDDCHLHSVRELANLLAEQPGWRFLEPLNDSRKTLLFRKETREKFLPDFGGQPYILRKTVG